MGLAMSSFFEDTNRYPGTDLRKSTQSTIHNCSITMAANQALRACKTTRCALQQLRDILINCPNCPATERCELNERFNQLIDQAVAAISEEWGW
jgi:hypothetical protein